MRNKIFYVFLLSFFFIHAATAQLSIWREMICDKQEIVFDATGKMIDYPKTFNTRNTKLTFKVRAAGKIYQPWIDQLQQSLQVSIDYVESEKIKGGYNCFFNGSRFEAFKTAAAAIIAWKTDSICKLGKFSNLSNMGFNEVIPIDKLIDNINNQYAVIVYKNNLCLDTVHLTTEENCSDGCIDFIGETGRIKNITCTSCNAAATDQLRFELVHYDPWDKTIRDWFKDRAATFKNQNKGKAMEGLVTALKNQVNDSTDAMLATSGTDLKPLKDWFINWFWFNGGQLQIDPFKIMTSKAKTALLKDIKTEDRKIADAKEVITYYDSAKAALIKKGGEIGVLANLQRQQATKRDELENAQKSKSDLEKVLATNALLPRLSSFVILYEGRLQPSRSFFSFSNPAINPQKQFDAFLKYKAVAVNVFQKRKLKEIPENEQMYIAVHNIPDTVKVRMDEKRIDFNDQEEFTTVVNDQLKQIDFNSLPVANIKNLEEFIKSLGTKPDGIGTKGQEEKTQTESCLEIVPLLAAVAVDVDSGKASFPPNPGLFDNLVATGPVYRTKLDAIQNFEPPYRDSITIKAIYAKDSTVDVAKTYVKVGKLRFIQLAAGVAVAKEPVTLTKIDTSGSGFKVSSSDNRAKAIFGFKIYPFKNYNRDNSIIPRYPLRRFSIIGAFEILHPLDNFYVGAAYDIVPGLAFSAGNHYYLETRYQVANNVITNTSRSYKKSGAYYSVVINPILFVQFVKLFFKAL
jgi:hypothetical protein